MALNGDGRRVQDDVMVESVWSVDGPKPVLLRGEGCKEKVTRVVCMYTQGPNLRTNEEGMPRRCPSSRRRNVSGNDAREEGKKEMKMRSEMARSL